MFDSLVKRLKTENSPRRVYNEMKDYAESINYDLNDVKKYFNNHKIFEKKSGLVLMALINNKLCSDEYVEIDLTNNEPIDYVGYELKGKMKVVGDVGDYAGLFMNDSELKIEGNAGNKIGWRIKKSNIKVNGSVKDYAGAYLTKKSSILIQGDAGNYLGAWMNGGKIIVNGKAGNYAGDGMKGGEIYVKKSVKNNLCTAMKGGFFKTKSHGKDAGRFKEEGIIETDE